jgi:hypothetical protein
MKTLSTFMTEAFIRELENDDIVESIVEYVVENDLTEEQTDELINEIFGIGATAARLKSKAAHPFKLAHAAIKGAVERVKEKVGNAVERVKQKSQEMDIAARKKHNVERQRQARQVKAAYTKASGKGGPATKPKPKTAAKPAAAKPTAAKTPVKKKSAVKVNPKVK